MKYLSYPILTFFVFLVLASCNEVDSDGDGVADAVDQCINTPLGESVNKDGCSITQLADDDNDGIPNSEECQEESIVFSKTEVVFRFPKEDVVRLKSLESDSIKIIYGFKNILKKYYKIESTEFTIDDLINAIENFEFCACGDLSPVLVSFDPSFEIESKLDNIKKETAEGGIEGDLNFNFSLLPNEAPNEVSGFYISTPSKKIKEILPKFISTSKKVIAVLDTGVDLLGQYSDDGQLTGAKSFIYSYDDPNNTNTCLTQYGGSGWNFVNNNYNFYDDQTGIGHGTLVTKTLTNELDLMGITDYSILPLKVFDHKGRGSYWKINCAMAYLNEIQENTLNANSQGDIKLINASFGGSFNALKADDLAVMKSFIDSLDESVLFVASAGNCGDDTDAANVHFPSGYSSKNIVSVGGYTLGEDNLSIARDIFSNYGTKSIDVAAPFALNKLKVNIIGNNSTITMGSTVVEGTSFSTPLVSAKLFELQLKNPELSPKDIIAKLYGSSNTNQIGNLDPFFKESRIYKPLQN